MRAVGWCLLSTDTPPLSHRELFSFSWWWAVAARPHSDTGYSDEPGSGQLPRETQAKFCPWLDLMTLITGDILIDVVIANERQRISTYLRIKPYKYLIPTLPKLCMVTLVGAQQPSEQVDPHNHLYQLELLLSPTPRRRPSYITT